MIPTVLDSEVRISSDRELVTGNQGPRFQHSAEKSLESSQLVHNEKNRSLAPG